MSVQPDPGAYGRRWAADYDDMYADRDDLSVVTAFVLALAPAPAGRVLELGVGTGRLAIPLAAAGLDVTGVDSSPEMLQRLAGRPGAQRMSVVLGDFTTVEIGGLFDVVLIAFSTIFLVPSQEGQLACLANARRHLRPGGAVVVEAFVPDHSRWSRGQNVSVGRLDARGVTLKLSVHDPVSQLISTQDVTVDEHGTTLRPNTMRYIWPAELDAMALAVGLRPERRRADWSDAPFTAASTSHVSVYRRPERSPDVTPDETPQTGTREHDAFSPS